MDPRRRTIAQGPQSAIPQSSTRRPAVTLRASVAPAGPSSAQLNASLSQAAGRFSMAPQRTTSGSMAPAPVQKHGSSEIAALGAIPGTVSRTLQVYGGGQQSGQRSDAGYLRHSHVPASNSGYVAPSVRRSSYGRRSSAPGHQGAQTVLDSYLALYSAPRTGLKDPRNLRNDAAARARCGTEIADFLVERRYPGEPKITQQTITQKDFENTFKFLYSLFDPAHDKRWEGKFEEEVVKRCVPKCGYPFAGEVNRSSLATVGAKHSWHVILGLLHWLTIAVKVRDACFDTWSEICIDVDAIDAEGGLERPQAKVEFWAEYLSRSYPLFLASEEYEDELEPHLLRLKDRYDAYQERSHQHIADLKDAAGEIELEIKRLEAMPNELEMKQQEHSKLQKDLDSLATFMQTLDKRSQQVKKQLDEFEKRITELEEQKKARQAEQTQLQHQVSQQNLSDADIQRLTTDRINLDEQSRALSDREMTLSKEGTELEVDLRRVMDRVEKQTDDYSTRLSRHGLIPRPPAGEYMHVDFTQEIDGSAPIAADIAPDAAKSAGIRPALVRMRQQANAERNRHIEAALLVEAEASKLNERITEFTEILAESEADHQALKEELDAAKDALASEIHHANLELEKRERENVEIRNNLSGGNLGADQRIQALDHEYTRLQAAVERVRKENTDALAESLDVIISFKDFVKTKVDDLYNLARE